MKLLHASITINWFQELISFPVKKQIFLNIKHTTLCLSCECTSFQAPACLSRPFSPLNRIKNTITENQVHIILHSKFWCFFKNVLFFSLKGGICLQLLFPIPSSSSFNNFHHFLFFTLLSCRSELFNFSPSYLFYKSNFLLFFYSLLCDHLFLFQFNFVLNLILSLTSFDFHCSFIFSPHFSPLSSDFGKNGGL